MNNPDQVVEQPTITQLVDSSGCQYKNQEIPETRSENSVPAWHWDWESGLITVAGGCKANFTVCYGKCFMTFSVYEIIGHFFFNTFYILVMF